MRRSLLSAIVILGLTGIAAISDAQQTAADPAARGLDAFIHAPDLASPGSRVPVQIQAFGFPTAISLTPLADVTVEAAWDPEHLGPGITRAPPSVKAKTDSAGRAHLEVEVPDGDERDLSLLVGVRVIPVIVTRLAPGLDSDGVGNVTVTEPSDDPYLSGLQQVQSRYLGEIERDFYPLPIFRGGWANTEMVGLPQLSALARTLFGDQDPGQIFHRGAAQTLEESGEDFLLRLPLPHLELNKVKLTKRGDELFVTIGNFKRELLLPAVLAQRHAAWATFENGILTVRFPPAA